MTASSTQMRHRSSAIQGTVRPANIEDAEAILEIYSPVVLETTISFEEVPPSPEEMARRILSSRPMFPFLVYEAQNKVVGYAYAGEHRSRPAYRWSSDTTVYVHECARRAGIARTLYTELLRALTSQRFHVAFAGIALPNAASVCLHESMGFKHLGTYPEVGYKQGKWLDVGWWHLPLHRDGEHHEPIPFEKLIAENGITKNTL